MDRLVCGDVGFGRTEVGHARRVQGRVRQHAGGRAVPTTIHRAAACQELLAARMKEGLPCRVDYINRFRSSAEQKRILADLKEGKIDIIIGTHRLVSKDVVYKDLGLVVIDEEQKFEREPEGETGRRSAPRWTLDAHRHADPAHAPGFSLHGRSRPQHHQHATKPNRYPVSHHAATVR